MDQMINWKINSGDNNKAKERILKRKMAQNKHERFL